MGNLAIKEREEQLPLAGMPEPQVGTSLIEAVIRAARDPSVDVEKMERLANLAERMQARDAERSFNEAMNEAQAEIRPIAADASNPQTKSKYASYLALDKALRPLYTKHGFALSFDTGDAAPDLVKVLCYVSHRDGHSRTYKVDMPADGKGAKGGDVMTKTHATGAAFTYGQRYLLKMIFNIAVGEDNDGNGASADNSVVSGDQIGHVRRLIDETNSDIEKFCARFKIDALPDLKRRDYETAIAMLNTKAKGVQK